ncbi:MAG: hypothetical protein KIS92_26135 [Planctomycetota bacterium]|nr:hypothetical protein [Planctomycetota bacterium]
MNTHPRPWFQLHLSTAVVLMLVAGCYFAVDLYPRRTPIRMGLRDHFEPGILVGWPALHYAKLENGEALCIAPLGLSILVNGAFLVVLLAATATSCEFFIRRRETRNP